LQEIEGIIEKLIVYIPGGLYVVKNRKGDLSDWVTMLDAVKKVFAIFEEHNLSMAEALAFLEAVRRNVFLFNKARLLPQDMEDLLR
jgi:hypothetical protein